MDPDRDEERTLIRDEVMDILHNDTGPGLVRHGVWVAHNMYHPEAGFLDDIELYYHVDFLMFGRFPPPVEDYHLDVDGPLMAKIRALFQTCQGIHGLAKVGITALVFDAIDHDIVWRREDFLRTEIDDIIRTGFLTFEPDD